MTIERIKEEHDKYINIKNIKDFTLIHRYKCIIDAILELNEKIETILKKELDYKKINYTGDNVLQIDESGIKDITEKFYNK